MARSGSAGKSTNVRFVATRAAAAGALKLIGDSLPGVSEELASWLWTSPGRHDRPERELEVLRRATRLKIPFGVHGLRAWTWGSGPTVLLVHGWEGRGSQLCGFVDPLVAAGFRVVAFDAPAHGDSGGERATLFTFAGAIDAAARRFGPIHGLVAHSMGAAASAYAIRGGLQVRRTVFVAPADAGQAVNRFARQLGLGPRTRERMEKRLVRNFGLPIHALSAEGMAPYLPDELLVIHDVDDGWVPVVDGEAYASVSGELHRTEGLGHHRVLRDDEVLARAVAFVAQDVGEASEPAWAEVPARPRLLTKRWTVPALFDLELDDASGLTDEELLDELRGCRD